MIDTNICTECGGFGAVRFAPDDPQRRVIACGHCGGTGEEPYHDPTTKPILWLIAVFVAYMIWQFFIR